MGRRGLPGHDRRQLNTSSDETVGKLGPGWVDSYGAALSVEGNGDASLRGEDGQVIEYANQGDGSFVGARGSRSILRAVAGGYELVRKDQVVYRFDTSGRLLSMRDRNDQGLTLAYAGSELQTITDSVGRQIALTYESGLLDRVTLPDGRYVEYGYLNGRLQTVRDARGFTTTYSYDTGGRLQRIVDQNDHQVVRNVYDPGTGRILEQYDAFEHRSTFAWDPTTQTATMTDARLKQWKDVYSGNLLVKRIDPLANVWRYQYDVGMSIRKVTDARGSSTTMTYDARGNMLTRTSPLPFSYEEIWTYTARNDPLTYRDRRGNTTDFGYDGAGNLTSVTRPDADGPGPLGRPQTLFGRDPGNRSRLTDPRGKTTSFSYLAATCPRSDAARTARPLLRPRTPRAVDPRGSPASCPTTTAGTTPTTPMTSWRRRPTRSGTRRRSPTTRPATRSRARTRTGTRPPTATTRRTRSPRTSRRRRAGSGSRLLRRAGTSSRGRTRTGTSPSTPTTTRTGSSRVTAPDNRHMPTTRTGVKRRRERELHHPGPRRRNDGYAYDTIDRLKSIVYSDSTPDVTFAYDGNDNRTELTDGSGTETYGFDPLDRLTSVTRGQTTGYDLVNLTSRTYPGVPVTSYAYDDDERLSAVSWGTNVLEYGYDAAGNLQLTDLPDSTGWTENRYYDEAGRLTEVRVGIEGAFVPEDLSSIVLTLDPVGNPLTTLPGTETYAYDDMDRLTGVCFQAGTCPGASDPFIRWSYDGVGNRLSEARPTGTTSYSHNAADELEQAGATSYTYDENGNQLSAGSRTFAWDLANRLRSTTLGSTTTSYSYDGEGKRLQASTGAAANEKTSFLWDPSFPLPQLVQESDGAGAPMRRYRHGHRPLHVTAGATVSYFHYDPLGSIVDVTAASGGALRWSYGFEPYGLTRQEQQYGSGPVNLLKFAGEYLDSSGLYHLRARQYDPGTGRFLTRDPVAAPLSQPHISMYGYVGNRPTMFVDPSDR